jgi:hypothetical protein
VLVKLTDKCNTTLQNAVANGLKSSSTPLIKVHVDADAASGKLVIAGVNEVRACVYELDGTRLHYRRLLIFAGIHNRPVRVGNRCSRR